MLLEAVSPSLSEYMGGGGGEAEIRTVVSCNENRTNQSDKMASYVNTVSSRFVA